MDDRELERLAKKLGSQAERRIDVERVADRVVARLRTEMRRPAVPLLRRTGVHRLLRIAAVLAVLVTAGLLMRDNTPAPDSPVFAAPLALDDLSDAELHDVLDSLEFAGPVQHVGRGGIDDLSDVELEQLLAMMES